MKTQPNDSQTEAQDAPIQPEPVSQPDPQSIDSEQDKPFDAAQDKPLAPSLGKPAPDKPVSPPAGGMPRFLRLGLIWLGVLLVTFLAGVLTYHFVRYQPTAASLVQANQSVANLQTKSDGLTRQLEIANGKIATLESENQVLQTGLADSNVHIELLKALTDINAAHIALSNQDISGAKVALSNTENQLDSLKPSIASVDAALADNISQRLALIVAGMERDADSAKVDLELLAKNLLDVETLLFSK